MNRLHKQTVILLALLVVGVIALGFGYFYWKAETETYAFAGEAKDGGYVMPEVALQEKMDQLAGQQNNFVIQINARPTADQNSGRCNLMVGNPPENTQNVRVDLIMDETGETVFTSEILKPGERCAYVTLAAIPAPGEYEMTAVFSILSEGTNELVGEIDAVVLLTMEDL